MNVPLEIRVRDKAEQRQAGTVIFTPLRYPVSMLPLIPRQLLDYTQGQLRSCEPAYCDLWLVSAKVDLPERKILENLLSANEREHAGRFRFEADRVRSIVARGGLRRILSSYCGASPHAMEFHIGSHGKPALLNPSALEFNVSHSGDCVLIAVTSGVPCGVDIELIRPIIEERDVADRFFCPREMEWLSRNENGFHRLWVMKEAIIKAMGLGVSIPLSHIDVTDILEGRTSSITLWTPGIEPQMLWLRELFLLSNYAAAVATVQNKRIVRLMPDRIERSFLQHQGEPESNSGGSI
jgi:4'-phosphopantetheinyl transferase